MKVCIILEVSKILLEVPGLPLKVLEVLLEISEVVEVLLELVKVPEILFWYFQKY